METAELTKKETTTKELFGKANIQERFEKLLGEKTQGFISSVLQIVNGSDLLAKAEPHTVLNAAATAASLDLPINQSLGFAYIVPYKGKAQFQIGWKGLVQLALRTGQYKKINAIEVYENQFKSFNSLTEELDADFTLEGEGNIVGYAAYFKLHNGMEKLSYWTMKSVIKHAKKYSQTYDKKNKYGSLMSSPWNDKDQFDTMAKKTVLKNTLSKWGIMSIEMQKAVLADQSVQAEEGDFQYPDNESVPYAEEVNEEMVRAQTFIKKAQSIKELESLEDTFQNTKLKLDEETQAMLDDKKQSLTKKTA